MSSSRILRVVLLGAAVAVAAFGLSGARGDLIILNDGVVLRGKTQVEGKHEMIRTEDGPIVEFIKTGFYYIDDGVRRIIFNPKLVNHVEPRKIDAENDIKWDPHWQYSAQARPTPPILEIQDVTPWDAKWNRKITYRGIRKEGKDFFHVTMKDIPQHLSMMTPEYAFADSLNIGVRWRAHYLTKELGPEVARELLGQHKDLKDDEKLEEENRVARRFRIYHFLTEAEWLTAADQELNKIEKEFPSAKERVDLAKKNLKALQAIELYDDLKRAHDAGQYQWVRENFKRLPDSGLPEKMHAEMRALQAEYETAEANLKL